MAGIARKVGSKDSRFCVFVYIPSLCSRARALSAFTSTKRLDRQNKRNGGLLTHFLSPFATLWRERRKSENPRRSFWSREGRMGFGRDSTIIENWKIWSDWPWTAQCQLPHNNVTFGMVPARDALCVTNVGTRKNIRDSFLRIVNN